MLNKEEIQSAKEFLYNLPSKIPLKFLTDEFCKQYDTHYDNMFEYIEQLVHEKDIMQRALSMQTQGWNEGAKLFAEKQKLIEKLEEDIRVYSKEGCCRKQVREGIVREAKEILEFINKK